MNEVTSTHKDQKEVEEGSKGKLIELCTVNENRHWNRNFRWTAKPNQNLIVWWSIQLCKPEVPVPLSPL